MNFNVDGINYDVIIEKKGIKNLYIRVTDDLKIKVSCPRFYTNQSILKLLEENTNSIKRMIEKQVNKNDNNKRLENAFLGKNLNVIYKEVKKAIYEDSTVIVKDKVMLDKWYKNKALETFKIYLDEAYYVFEEKIPYPILKVRQMKTRWGVCNRKDNSVTLNLELIKKDHKYLNYVIVHELSHFVHFDHSKAFWKTVEKYCPEYKKVRKELKE